MNTCALCAKFFQVSVHATSSDASPDESDPFGKFFQMFDTAKVAAAQAMDAAKAAKEEAEKTGNKFKGMFSSFNKKAK